jgi:sortase A
MAIPRAATPTPSNAWGPLPPHASRPPRAWWRWVERLLFVVALLSIGYYGYVTVEASLYQSFETRELDAILQSAPPPSATGTPIRHATVPDGATIGKIEIPRLGVSAIVRSGADATTLRLAVGHIAGTAFPGEPGNVGLAGHRDTFFRKLRNIRPNDVIRVRTPDGTFNYRVSQTTVVNPKDVWVLDQGSRPLLTLVTCYPFSYIGSAPQRFIVRAELLPAVRAVALQH